MPNVKISDLPAASSAAGTDQLETNQSGTSRRLTVAQVATHVRSTATDTVVVAAGSAAAPSIAPTGDSNTGIFFPAADTIAFSEGGVEALRLDSSGNATFAGTAAMASSFLRNRLINGDMRIDQRNNGGSVSISSAANTYFVDRWRANANGGGVFSVQRSTVAPAGFTNSILATVTTPDSSVVAGDFYHIRQSIEGFNFSDFGFGTASAATVTISFWVRASVTGTYSLLLRNSAGNRGYATSYTISSANTWEYKTATIPGDTSGTWPTDNSECAILNFSLGGVNTQTANSWQGTANDNVSGQPQWISTNGATFYLTGVQLEVGSAATPFERRQYGQELALCQRYFEVGATVSYFGVAGIGQAQATAPFKATKRATPTIALTSRNGQAQGALGITTNEFNINVVVANAYIDASWTAAAEL